MKKVRASFIKKPIIVKVISVFLLVALTVSLCACGKVANVQNLINKIGEVSIDSKDAIQAAQDAYDELSDEEKGKVENVDLLKDAAVLYAKIEHYSNGEKAFDKADYKTAITEFKGADDYNDAKNKLRESEQAAFYTTATELFEKEEYVAAVEYFVNTDGYKDSDLMIFEAGKKLIEKGQYSDAADVLEKTTQEGASSFISYAKASEEMGKKDYTHAQTHFAEAGDTLDAPDMVKNAKFMEAETYYEDGKLNSAKSIYKSLPSDFSYKGKSVSTRLASLEKFDAFVKLCGVWKSTSMNCQVRQTYKPTGSWDSWDNYGWNYDLTITCVINNDDTVTMRADAGFYHYTNFSTLSSLLKTTEDTCNFKYTGTTVPSTINYSLNLGSQRTGTLTINDGTFSFNYEISDPNYSTNFSILIKTWGEYGTFVKAL